MHATGILGVFLCVTPSFSTTHDRSQFIRTHKQLVEGHFYFIFFLRRRLITPMCVPVFIYAATRPDPAVEKKKPKQESFPERLAVTQVSNSSNGRRAAPCRSAPDKRVEASDTFSDLILMHGGFGGNERAGLCSLGLQTARRTSARPLGGES